MAHIPCPEVSVARLGAIFYPTLGKGSFEGIEQGAEGGSVPQRHIVNLIGSFCFRGGRQQIDLYHIFDETKVPAGFAVAVDGDLFALDHGSGPFGDDGGVGSVGVLTFTEHIEVAQTDGVEAVGSCEDVGVEFVDVLGDRVRGKRLADGVFYLGQARVVTVGRAGGGVGEADYPFIFGGHQHVQKTINVGLVGGDRVFDGSGDGAESGLVKDIIHAACRFSAVFQVSDVAFDEGEAGPLLGGDRLLDFIQVVLVAGGEVVQTDDGLVKAQQGFEQIGADEARHAGDEPSFGPGFEVLLYLFVAGCHGDSVFPLFVSLQASSYENLFASQARLLQMKFDKVVSFSRS